MDSRGVVLRHFNGNDGFIVYRIAPFAFTERDGLLGDGLKEYRRADEDDEYNRKRSQLVLFLVKEYKHKEDCKYEAENTAQQMMRKSCEHSVKIILRYICKKSRCNGEHRKAQPVFLFHQKRYCATRQSKHGDDKPIFVILEETPARRLKRYFKQINKRLADEEKDEALQRGLPPGFAVHDDENGEEDCVVGTYDQLRSWFKSVNFQQGLEYVENNLFDYPSFREAWINACLHNDWNNAIAPSIYMFDDRIEIVSYGGLPYTLTKEGFFNGTSVPVNKGLLLVFIAAGYAEQSGHGVPTIVNKYGRDVFSFDDGMIKVTIPLAFDRNDVVARKNAIKQKNGLTKNQKTVYEILSEDGRKSLQEVADETGLSLAGVKKICLKLQECGILEREGSKKDGYWITK